MAVATLQPQVSVSGGWQAKYSVLGMLAGGNVCFRGLVGIFVYPQEFERQKRLSQGVIGRQNLSVLRGW